MSGGVQHTHTQISELVVPGFAIFKLQTSVDLIGSSEPSPREESKNDLPASEDPLYIYMQSGPGRPARPDRAVSLWRRTVERML